MFHHQPQFYLLENQSQSCELSNVGQGRKISQYLRSLLTLLITQLSNKKYEGKKPSEPNSVKEEEWLVFIHHLSGQYFENQDDKNDGSVKNLKLIGQNVTIVVCQLKMVQLFLIITNFCRNNVG